MWRLLGRRCRGLVSALLLCLAGAVSAAEKPNVVIFLADDLGWADVGYHGGDIATPSIDRLAQEGVKLERFYVMPICSPTRAALMTGRDPLVLGIAYDQIHPWYNAGLAADEVVIAELFRAAGYQTGLVGKWHLGHSQAHQTPNAQGFDEFFGHLHTNTDYYSHQREGGHDLQRNGTSVHAPGEYLTRLQAREALRFVRERDPDSPFFLYVPFTAPHSPMQAPEETIDKYRDLPQENFRRIYAAMVDEMDQAMGEMLDLLDAQGLTENTLVLFFSDNGGFNAFGGNNLPLKGQKGQAYEGGIRVPAVMRWPAGLSGGEVSDQLVSVLDVLPTLAAASGIAIPDDLALDGQDVWAALRSGVQVPREKPLFFVSEIPIPGLISAAVIDAPWKLVQQIREGQTRTDVRTALYRLDQDPYEQQDLASGHPEQVERLAEALRQWRAQHPLAGTRSTLVPHPGWVAPLDWAAAVQPSSGLQDAWRNELPFTRAIFDAIGDRGRLVDPETKRRLLEEERARKTQFQ